jgi:hypothetical protein
MPKRARRCAAASVDGLQAAAGAFSLYDLHGRPSPLPRSFEKAARAPRRRWVDPRRNALSERAAREHENGHVPADDLIAAFEGEWSAT